MKGLKVLDKDGNALGINRVDREICELFGNEVDAKWYSVMVNKKEYIEKYIEEKKIEDPTREKFSTGYAVATLPNWFDTIGYMCSNGGKTLDDVVEYYKETMKDYLGKPLDTGEIITLEMIYPGHLKVINYFKEQGYTLIGVDC